MKWTKFTLKTTTEAVDLISSMLDEIGIEGIEIEDNVPLSDADTKGMFIDILPELPPDDGTAKVSFYVEDLSNLENIIHQVNAGLDEIAEFVNVGERSLSVSETEDKDWINNWKQYFKPFTVDDILIKPTWETIPEEHKDKLLIQIDPGTAFGTGILGIAALKLGAKSVFGTDLDENAIVAVGENLESNNIPADRFHVVQGNIIDDQAIQDQAGYECYDIAAANILAPVIIMLQGEICKHIKHGGMFITSGIINTKEQDVKDAMNANPELEIVETTYQGDWVSITARRK